MKISVTLVNRIIIMAVVSIILIAIVPYLSFHLLQKHVVDEAVISFQKHAAVTDSIFTEEFLDNPRIIEGFDYEGLLALGPSIDLDLSETIKKSKEPHGSDWLLDALGDIIVRLVQILAKKVIIAYVRNRIISSILSLLCMLFVFILGKELLKKVSAEKDDDLSTPLLSKSQAVYRSILSITILAGCCYSIFYFIKNLIIFIQYPPVLAYPAVNAKISFYFEGLVILVGIAILISVLIILNKKSNNQSKKYLAFFWTVPVLAIILNIYLDNFQISMLNTIVDTQNLNSYRQKNVNYSAEIAYSARQWFLQNEGQYNLKDYIEQRNLKIQNLEHGTYEISANDTLLTITGKGNFVTKEGINPKVEASYNTIADSINVEILK